MAMEEARRARGERLKGPRVAPPPSVFGHEGRRRLVMQVGGWMGECMLIGLLACV